MVYRQCAFELQRNMRFGMPGLARQLWWPLTAMFHVTGLVVWEDYSLFLSAVCFVDGIREKEFGTPLGSVPLSANTEVWFAGSINNHTASNSDILDKDFLVSHVSNAPARCNAHSDSHMSCRICVRGSSSAVNERVLRSGFANSS